MIFLKSEEEIEVLREGAEILSRVHGQVASMVQPGVATRLLDVMAEEFIRDHGAVPSFKGYGGFPATLCVSVNDCVVHGIPGDYLLQEGDIVSVDCGVFYKEFHSDSAFTLLVGAVGSGVKQLLRVTEEALYRGIEAVKEGSRVGNISCAVQSHVQRKGFAVVRDLVGHGIGRNLHEEPQVPNYGRRSDGEKLQEGMVLAIEPMVNEGSGDVYQGHTGEFRTVDGRLSAHFEHTVGMGKSGVEVLTTYKYIKDRIHGEASSN